MGETFDKIEKI